MRRRSPLQWPLLAGSVLALVLASCATDTPTSPAPPDATEGDGDGPGTTASRPLRIVAAEPTSGLDTTTAVTQASLRVMELMYDGLLDYNSEGEVVPGLAESWEESSDGTTYTFQLQPDARFSDGSPITADDVVFSLERAAQGEALGASLDIMTGIEAVDDSTVQITLSEQSRVFLNALARVGIAGILSREAVEGNDDYFTQPTATSGPWMLTEYIPRDHLTLEANPHYWQGPPSIGTISYTFSDDPTSAAAALESGTADMYYPMAPTDALRLEEAGVINIFSPASPGVLFWGIDHENPPFDDVRVRQAIAYMVPREDRRETCWEGTGGVSFGAIILEGSWAHSEGLDRFNVSEEEALQTASELLDEAGWVMGDGDVRIAEGVDGVEDGTSLRVEVPFESNWQQSRCNTQLLRDRLLPLGVDIQPQAYDPASFWSDVGEGAFTMFHGGNGWATVDDMMQQGFTTDGQSNAIVARWSNAEVDELVAEAHRTADVDEARDLYRQAQEIILDELPIINTGAQYSIVGIRPVVSGYEPRPDNSNRSLIHATLSD